MAKQEESSPFFHAFADEFQDDFQALISGPAISLHRKCPSTMVYISNMETALFYSCMYNSIILNYKPLPLPVAPHVPQKTRGSSLLKVGMAVIETLLNDLVDERREKALAFKRLEMEKVGYDGLLKKMKSKMTAYEIAYAIDCDEKDRLRERLHDAKQEYFQNIASIEKVHEAQKYKDLMAHKIEVDALRKDLRASMAYSSHLDNELNKLRLAKFTMKERLESTIEELTTCPICFTNSKTWTRMCGHRMCHVCIKKVDGEPCPYCRLPDCGKARAFN